MKQTGIIALTAAVHRFLVGIDDDGLKSYLTDWPSTKDAFRAISPCDLPVLACMKTGASPLLALYLWRAGDLVQKSLIDSQPG